MADLSRRRLDDFIMPDGPRAWRVRYFLHALVQADNLTRHNAIRFHGTEGGCHAGRSAAVDNVRYVERTVYKDRGGNFWYPDPEAITNRLNGWRPTVPCGVCGLSDIESVLAERFDWADRGECYGTHYPGFFHTQDGDGVGPRGSTHRQERLDALAICNGNLFFPQCPVRDECQDWGRRVHVLQPLTGIFGGEDEIDRREALRA